MESETERSKTTYSFFIPVVIAIVSIIGVYAFSIKPAKQPAFDKLSVIDDRKPAGKKRKIKEKVNMIKYLY